MPKVRLKTLQSYWKWIIWVALHICKVRKADISTLTQCKWWCPLPGCKVRAQRSSVPEAGQVVALLLCSGVVWGLELSFSCSPQLNAEVETAAEPRSSQTACSPCQRHGASSGPLGLISRKAAPPNTSGHLPGSAWVWRQHRSTHGMGAKEPHGSEPSLQGVSPDTIPPRVWGWGWQGAGCWGHPHGQLRSTRAQVLGPVGLLRCLGTGAPFRDAQVAPQEAGGLC